MKLTHFAHFEHLIDLSIVPGPNFVIFHCIGGYILAQFKKGTEWRTEYGLLRAFSHLDLSTLLFHLRSRLLDLVGFCRTTDNINKHRSEIVQIIKKLTSLSKLSAKKSHQPRTCTAK